VILCLNDLLDGDLCKNIFYFHISLFFWFLNMILSDAFILPALQLQTQQVMTSQIVPHRILNTNLLYSCAHFIVKIDEKCSLIGGFNTI